MEHLARVHPSPTRGGTAEGEETTRFCTHCATLFDPPSASADRPHRGRVCNRCGLGMVLRCSSELLSNPDAAFLVVTADLRVSAASQTAESLFEVAEGLFGRPLLSLITSPEGVGELARRVARAAGGAREVSSLTVHAAASNLPVSGLEARIGPCGDPPAALVVVELVAA